MAHYHVVCASSCGVFALLWCDCSHCAYLLIFPNVRSFARISLPRCPRVPRSALNFIFRVYARVIPPVLRVFCGVCAMCACGLSCLLLRCHVTSALIRTRVAGLRAPTTPHCTKRDYVRMCASFLRRCLSFSQCLCDVCV